ncbi:hypothetical protein [Rhizobium sp. NXC24]|uniref:hypothetical protein n=1 Tax=Rhizobium sp. NXC24 TaxID=2048897 RepID=UPI000CDF3EE1|nr:hypothetical protein [Rhizobium sp. NXC24]AVA24300.1 hypothetical protein NXC24_PB00373 [Rhizobium sp. NXC24]
MFVMKAVLIMVLTTSAGQKTEYLELPDMDSCDFSRFELSKFGPPEGATKIRVSCAPLKVYVAAQTMGY